MINKTEFNQEELQDLPEYEGEKIVAQVLINGKGSIWVWRENAPVEIVIK